MLFQVLHYILNPLELLISLPRLISVHVRTYELYLFGKTSVLLCYSMFSMWLNCRKWGLGEAGFVC